MPDTGSDAFQSQRFRLEGSSGGLLGQPPTQGEALKLGLGCSGGALLGHGMLSLRMEMTRSLWATCCTCSCSATPSNPVGIFLVATCGCCLLCFHHMPLRGDELHFFAVIPHWVLFNYSEASACYLYCAENRSFGYWYYRRCTSQTMCCDEG